MSIVSALTILTALKRENKNINIAVKRIKNQHMAHKTILVLQFTFLRDTKALIAIRVNLYSVGDFDNSPNLIGRSFTMATTNTAGLTFNVLGKKASGASADRPKKGLPRNLAMRLDKIVIGQNGDPSFFHGFAVGTNAPVAVRMMTVTEGVEVNGRKDEEADAVMKRVHKMYIGDGDAHRPKPGEVNNPDNKTHCAAGGLIQFTKCLQNDDGTWRAHWVETLESKPGAACDVVTAHLRVREKTDGKQVKSTQVFADVINPAVATVLTKDNLVATLTTALSNGNGEVKCKPFASFRLVDAEGKVVLPPYRVDAKYNKASFKDGDTGEEFEIYEAASAEESIKNLFDPANIDRPDLLAVRAALHGLGDVEGYPDYSGVTNEKLVQDLKSISDYVRDGSLKVEVIPGERISAGPSTKSSIIKAVNNNPRHPIHNYLQRGENGQIKAALFTETFLVTKIGPDGQRYFTKAVPVDLYPKMRSLKNLATGNDQKAGSAIAQERVADANSANQDVPEGSVPFNPADIDTAPQDSVEAKLDESSRALANDGLGYE